MKDVMLDLETLDTRPTSAILSIGAVEFDINSDKIGRTFHTRITMGSTIAAGLTVSGNTLEWWFKQSPEARGALFTVPAVHLYDALANFATWIPDDARVWGNGATFDNVVLKNAYEVQMMEVPWSYRNDMCYRTLKNLADGYVEPPPFEGVQHDALNDAIHQAKHLQRISAWLRTQAHLQSA